MYKKNANRNQKAQIKIPTWFHNDTQLKLWDRLTNKRQTKLESLFIILQKEKKGYYYLKHLNKLLAWEASYTLTNNEKEALLILPVLLQLVQTIREKKKLKLKSSSDHYFYSDFVPHWNWWNLWWQILFHWDRIIVQRQTCSAIARTEFSYQNLQVSHTQRI